MTKAPDRPGPHPENQRKRTELRGPRHALIGVLLIGALGAVVAGALAATRGNPSALGLTIVSPFASVRGTGGLLAILIGGSQALAAFLLLAHHERARMVALIAALIAVAWSALHGMMLGGAAFPLVLFAFGALEVMLVAGCTPRDAGKPKKLSMRAPR